MFVVSSASHCLGALLNLAHRSLTFVVLGGMILFIVITERKERKLWPWGPWDPEDPNCGMGPFQVDDGPSLREQQIAKARRDVSAANKSARKGTIPSGVSIRKGKADNPAAREKQAEKEAEASSKGSKYEPMLCSVRDAVPPHASTPANTYAVPKPQERELRFAKVGAIDILASAGRALHAR